MVRIHPTQSSGGLFDVAETLGPQTIGELLPEVLRRYGLNERSQVETMKVDRDRATVVLLSAALSPSPGSAIACLLS